MITNPCRGLLKTVKVNKDPWGTARELLVSSIAVGLGRWNTGRHRLWDRPSFPGAEAASGGSWGIPGTRVMSGERGEQVTVPRCYRLPGAQAHQAMTSLGQPCQSTSTPAQKSWTGASEINWSRGDAQEHAVGQTSFKSATVCSKRLHRFSPHLSLSKREGFWSLQKTH